MWTLRQKPEVSIISDKVYRSLKNPPKKLKDITLHTAGRQMVIQGFIVGPTKLKIGSRWYQVFLHVAPIDQDMLLGFDILCHRGKCVLDMPNGILTFDGQEIPLDVGSSGHVQVARVTVARRRVIPPNSAIKIPCQLSREMPDYVIEPVENLKVLAPRVVRDAGEEPVMCLVNVSDRYRLIKKGAEIARAYPINEYIAQELADPCTDPPDGHTETEILDHDPPKVTEDLPGLAPVHDPQGASVMHDPQGVEVGPNERSSETKPKLVAEISTNQYRSTVEEETDVPEHLKLVYDNSSRHLSVAERVQLAELLRNYQDVFAKDEFDFGNFSEIEHSITVEPGAKPVKQRIRRTPACFAGEEEAHLEKMLKAGVIQESTSEWASAPVLIRKRDGTVRWCIDYRALNSVTIKNVFPLPLADDCLETLSGSVWFSKLDAISAYWQVKIKDDDRKKTAFITKYGLFEHVKIGFGLCNAPATYARVMNLVMKRLHWKTVLAFLDDILVLGKNFQDHLVNLEEALARFSQYGLKLKPKKCVLFQKQEAHGPRVAHLSDIATADMQMLCNIFPILSSQLMKR